MAATVMGAVGVPWSCCLIQGWCPVGLNVWNKLCESLQKPGIFLKQSLNADLQTPHMVSMKLHRDKRRHRADSEHDATHFAMFIDKHCNLHSEVFKPWQTYSLR